MMGITTPSGGIASRLRQEVGGRRDLTGQERACPPLRFERADSVVNPTGQGNVEGGVPAERRAEIERPLLAEIRRLRQCLAVVRSASDEGLVGAD
jgi:hypothetical protein